jgi:hypothetical protein
MRASNRPATARRPARVQCACGDTCKTTVSRYECDCGREYRRRVSSAVRYDYMRGTGPGPVYVTCEECGGSGCHPDPTRIECDKCDGAGRVRND